MCMSHVYVISYMYALREREVETYNTHMSHVYHVCILEVEREGGRERALREREREP